MTTAGTIDWAGLLARAREIVAAALPVTPLVESPGLGEGVLLKLESFQPTGSFKVRGALAALTAAGDIDGVVTASSGNHALGVAWAAQRLGIPATLVLPVSTSPAKLASLQRFQVTVVIHGDGYEHAERHARSLASTGLLYVSATSNPDVIAGQATIGGELLAHLHGPFAVACGVGGGALASGLGLVSSQSGRMSVIGVEAAASLAMSTAVGAGEIVPVEVGETLADGLAGNLEPGIITVDLISRHVSRLIAVTEEQIAEAIRYLAREHGVIAEGSGAAPVAAILAGAIPVTGQTVAIITGRNITFEALTGVLRSGYRPGGPATNSHDA
ncbi:MAG: threonine ammonia-lyase [Streptosporangiaceae bacterium]